MARYTGPVCRLCRRQGTKLFLKGERCYTPRCPIEKRRGQPGDRGARAMRRRVTEYGQQLNEKQKARQIYGLLERQFRNYVDRATRLSGVTGDRLIEILERRLDNAVFRLSFADSRTQARQLVAHGHIQVNGRRVSIPSFQVEHGDTITWRDQSRNNEYYKVLVESLGKRPVPRWLNLDRGQVQGTVVAAPEPTDVDTSIDTRLIVEYYSRR